MEAKVKWEYTVITLPDGIFDQAIRHTVELKKLSGQGWELVSVVDHLAYFKRPGLIELTPPEYVDAAQLEAMVRKVIAEEFGLDKK